MSGSTDFGFWAFSHHNDRAILPMQHIPIGHAALLADLATCLNWYRMASPGLYCCVHSTLELPDGHVLQPGILMMVNHGSQKRASTGTDYDRFSGSPNFIADVFDSASSSVYEDRKQRFAKAGVTEYLAVFDTHPLTWNWHVLSTDGAYQLLEVNEEGVLRSPTLPGLWVPEASLSSRDWWTLMSTITRGVTRRGHHDFMQTIWHPQ